MGHVSALKSLLEQEEGMTHVHYKVRVALPQAFFSSLFFSKSHNKTTGVRNNSTLRGCLLLSH